MRIGIDLGGTKIEIIALAEKGDELYRKRVPTPKNNYASTLQTIADLVHEAEQTTGQTGSIGMGIPGTISPYSGRVKNANSTYLNGQTLDQDIIRILGRPVRIANDANCLAVSEATDGAGAGSNVVFAVIIGTGCGAGVAMGGQTLVGGNGIAGEWGHNPLPWQDAEEQRFQQDVPCYCGKAGCIETFISGTGFITDYTRMSGERLTGEEIVSRAANGDALAEKALCHYEVRLTKSLAHVINILDPDVIVLGGGMSNIERFYTTVPETLNRWVLGGECRTPVRKALHGDSSGVRGAAWLWPNDKRC